MNIQHPRYAPIIDELLLKPAEIKPWQELMMATFDERDVQSFHSLQAIVNALAQFHDRNKSQRGDLPHYATFFNAGQLELLRRLATNPCDVSNLKKAINMFLNELRLPSGAARLISCSLELNPADSELAAMAREFSAQANNPQTDTVDQLVTQQEIRRLAAITNDTAAKLDAKAMIKMSARLDKNLIDKLKDRKMGRKMTVMPRVGGAPQILPQSPAAPPEGVTPAPGSGAAMLRAVSRTVKTQIIPAHNEGQSPDFYHGIGVCRVLEGELEQAFTEYEKAAGIAPDFPQLPGSWIELGVAFYQKQKLTRAIDCYRKAIESKQDSADAWFNLAATLHELGHENEALDAYVQVALLDPAHARAWCNMGALYFQREEYQQAVKASQRAVEARPDYAKAWDNLGTSLSVLNRIDEAIGAFEQSLKLKPESPETWFRIGSIHFEREEHALAAACFASTLQHQPAHSFALCYLAMSKARTDSVDDALAACKQAAAQASSCEVLWAAWNEAGLSLVRSGRPGEAVECFIAAAEKNPKNENIWYHLGVAMDQSGQSKGAIKCFLQAIKLKPDFVVSWNNLGTLYLEQHMLADAAQVFERVTILDSHYAKAWFNLGLVREQQGRLDDAAACMKKAQDLDPSILGVSSETTPASGPAPVETPGDQPVG
jgi:tetratricopeptide (TPR) repeat protein